MFARLALDQPATEGRTRAPHQIVSARVTNPQRRRTFDRRGADGGPALAEYLRNVIRRAVGAPLDFAAGYAEGKARGWTEANERFRGAIKKAAQ